VGALLELNVHLGVADGDLGRGVDEVAEQVGGLGVFVAIADARTEEPIKAGSHQRELQVAVDLHRHGRGQRIHMEELDAVGDAVLDDHALGVAGDELDR